MDVIGKNIRFATQKDMEKIYKIDRASYLSYMREGRIEKMLRTNNCLTLVADIEDELAGYLIYHALQNKFVIDRLAVVDHWRRFDCGTVLMKRMQDKLGPLKKVIEMMIPESNLTGQLFLNSLGFKVEKAIKNYYTTYHDSLPCVPYIEDGVLFRYSNDKS
jgi:ribosomal protein S18 acetylase RimI-like enzyme